MKSQRLPQISEFGFHYGPDSEFIAPCEKQVEICKSFFYGATTTTFSRVSSCLLQIVIKHHTGHFVSNGAVIKGATEVFGSIPVDVDVAERHTAEIGVHRSWLKGFMQTAIEPE